MAYTTDWQILDPKFRVQAINAVSTVKNLPLGMRVLAVDRGSNENGVGEFMYVKGVASGALGAFVGINFDDFSTTLATANGVYPLIGVMMSVLDATTDYGWVQISGKAVGLCLAGFLDNADCYLTGTAGSVDDTDVAGDYILNLKGASAIDAPDTGFAEFEMHYPSTDDAKDN